MAVLNANQRKHIASSTFGLPGERKFPMPDKVHARVAKSYASKEEHEGRISASQEAQIDRKADAVLGKKRAYKRYRMPSED